MNLSVRHTLGKDERAFGKTLTSQLFEGGASSSMMIYPVRMVYMTATAADSEPRARILISVPKRMLHHAVDRNRVKRQIREAFRKNKHIVNRKIAETSGDVIIAFIWTDRSLHPSKEIDEKIIRLLQRLEEKL